MIGIDLLIRELQRRGVEYVATLCGNGLNPFDESCRRLGLRLVDVRNEQAAGYIAEMTGRFTRRVGVCAVSSGVAHANGLTGVVNAHFDGAPMLLITGCGPTKTIGRGHFQDMDHVALAAPVCKYARLVLRPERIPQYVHEAFAAALTGRPGPVHLTLPMDVQTSEIDETTIVRPLAEPESRVIAARPDPTQIKMAADLLMRAKRPLMICGSGAYYAHAELPLRDFVQQLDVPVVVPIWDRGAVPDPIEQFMGVIGAATGSPRLLPDADLILLVGAEIDYRLNYLDPSTLHPDAKVIRIDADSQRLQQGTGAHMTVCADPGAALQELAEVCRSAGVPPFSEWLNEAQRRRTSFRVRVRQARERAGAGIHALDIVDAVRAVLTDETVLIADGGNIGQWVHQTIDRYPGHWVSCGASGAIGFGLPAAMAARLAFPDRPVILISGDGSLTFGIAELETASRQGLPFVALVADDQAWGITLAGQTLQYGHGTTSELGPIRFDQLAEALGARGVRVSQATEIEPAIRAGLALDRPTLIHVPVVRSSPADS